MMLFRKSPDENPNENKRRQFPLLAFLLMAGFLTITTTACYLLCDQFEVYQRLKNKAVTVDAVVTDVKIVEDEDTDGNVSYSYNHFISYNYDGQDYHNVFYKKRAKQMDCGTHVNVRVDPDEPTTICPGKITVLGLILIAAAAAVISTLLMMVALAFWPNPDPDSVSVYLSPRIVSEELNAERGYFKKPLLVLLIYLIASGFGFFLFFRKHESYTLAYVIAGYGLVMFVALWLIGRKRMTKPDDLVIRNETFLGVKYSSDGDGSPLEKLCFTNHTTWYCSNLCGHPSYSGFFISNSGIPLSPGDPVYIVYNRKNKPLRVYPANEFFLSEYGEAQLN